MPKAQGRDLGPAEKLRSGITAVTGDDPSILVDEDRVVESEGCDRGGDLRDLLLAVPARVPLRRAHRVDRTQLDLQGADHVTPTLVASNNVHSRSPWLLTGL
jgi:hypothetical protein